MNLTITKNSEILLKDSHISNEFKKNGYYIGKNILGSDKINSIKLRLNSHLDRFAKSYLEPFENSKPEYTIDSRISEILKSNYSFAHSLLNAILTDSHNDPIISSIFSNSQINSVINLLIPNCKILSKTIRVRSAIYGIDGFTTNWHQDLADEYRNEGNCNLIKLAIWIPLSDVTKDTGALECIPGTYTKSLMIKDSSKKYLFPEHILNSKKNTTLECNKGDAIFLDRFLPHRSLPVKESVNRWSVVAWVKAEYLN